MHDFIIKIQAQAAQQAQYDQLTQIAFWVVVVLAVILLGMIALMFFRKLTRVNHLTQGQSHDITDLYSVKDKGLLTPEEMKNVRDAIVRQIKREQEEVQQKKSTGDLAVFVTQLQHKKATGSSADQTPPPPVPKPFPPKITATGFTDDNPPAPPRDTPTAPPKKAAMDIDALLAKGIIGEAEYNQLKAHFRNKK